MKNYAIILASGSSNRFGDKIPKQFIKIEGQTILEKSIEAFEKNENITDIILITNPDYIEYTQNLVKDKFSKLRTIQAGGKTRQESSSIGVSLIEETEANVLIHDGARPFVSQEIITNCINALKTNNAVGVAINSNDTIIKLDENGYIAEIPNRNSLRRIQTPQCFKLSIIKTAHQKASTAKDLVVTDDCGLVLHFNLAKIAIIEGDETNIKITHKSDLKL